MSGFISVSSFLSTLSDRCIATDLAFSFTGSCHYLGSTFISMSFLVLLLSTRKILIIFSSCDLLISANCDLPRVSVKFSISKTQVVIKIFLVCLLMPYSLFDCVSTNITSFLFTSWSQFIFLYFSVDLLLFRLVELLLSGDLEVFFTPFTFIITFCHAGSMIRIIEI